MLLAFLHLFVHTGAAAFAFMLAVVLSGTDHLSHSLWGDPRLDEHFERADRHLAALLEAAGERVACMLVSDHGFGPGPRRRAHLGRWLHDRGWLVLHPGSALEGQGLVGGAARRVREGLPPSTWKALRDRLPGSLRRWAYERSDEARQVDLGSSEAFRVELYEGWEGIRLLREERRGELCAALAEEPFVASVKSREEVFRGDFLSEIPDVIVEVAEGFCGGSALGPGPLVEELSEAECSVRAGSHRRDGVLVLSGPGVVARAPLGAPAVADVGPTLLALAGLPVPEGLDGRVLSEALLSAPAYVPGSELTGPLKSAAASAARIADLEEPLRRLGYLA